MSFYQKGLIILFTIFLFTNWVKNIIDILMALTLTPLFGHKCNQISLFGLTFIRRDNKWQCSFQKPSILCQYLIIVDKSKPVPADIEKKEKQYLFLSTCIPLILSLLIFIPNWDVVFALVTLNNLNVTDLFLASFAIGMIYHSLAGLVIHIYTYHVIMKRLGGYVQSLTNRLQKGDSFEMLNLKPLKELPYENPTKVEEMMYYNFYLPYLMTIGHYDEMQEPIQKMTEHYREREYIIQSTLSYYWLIFYYSRFEVNPSLADLFLKKVWATISTDSDANAKRVLAYYYFGIKNDVEKARQYIEEGYRVVDKFSFPGSERELERKLLSELEAIINNCSE